MTQTQAMTPQQAAAHAVCNALHRSCRDTRLYPPGHPSAHESVGDLEATVDQYLKQFGALVLGVWESELVVDGAPVFGRDTGRDNLAFLMFRDGLRSLVIRRGVERGELERLVDALAHADDLASIEHDLVTVLWERELDHIDYQVVDPFQGIGTLREGMVDALRETVVRRLDVVQTNKLAAPDLYNAKVRRVTARYYSDQVLKLTPEEVERAEREVAGLGDVLKDYSEVVLEVAAKLPVTASSDAVMQSLAAVVGAYLDRDDVDGALFILDRLSDLEVQRWCPGGSVGFVAETGISTDHIWKMLEALRQAPPDRVERIDRLLLMVRKWITPPLLEILTGTNDRAIRKIVLELLGDEAAVPWRDLEHLLGDERWYVVRNAVHLAAEMGHEELAEHASHLMSHRDVRVRRETVRAMGRLASTSTVRVLAQALSDTDASVRTLAANALGRKGGPEQKAQLLARIEDRNFPSLASEEMEAFLAAYAELAQDKALPLLMRLWKKNLFSAKPSTVRIAAVLALGRVRSAAAMSALKTAARSDEQLIRRAAAEALQRRAGGRSEEQ
jgi:hypothetical protein